MDALHLQGMNVYGYIGVLPEERSIGQWFAVDMSISLDLSPAGQSDRLEDTYDYSAVVESVETLIQSSEFQLLEALAEAIATLVLQSDKVKQVNVRLTKLRPPVANFTGTVTVDITRKQTAKDRGLNKT